MKPFFKTVMSLLCLASLIGCKGNIENFNTIMDEEEVDSIITINEFPDREVILTSHLNSDALILYIPFEIVIKKQKNEEIFGITPIIYANAQGGIPKQYPINEIGKFQPLAVDFFEQNPNQNKIIQYRFIKMYPKRDTIAKSFIKELEFIKANCKESNKYFNDTIRYKNIKEFVSKHEKFYNHFFEYEDLKVDLFIKKDTVLKEYKKIYTFKY